MKKFLIHVAVFTFVTGVCVLLLAVFIYDVLPKPYFFNHIYPNTKIVEDHFRRDKPGYDTLVIGVSDMQRNIIPAVLDQSDPDHHRKSYNASQGILSTEYLIRYTEALILANPQIKTVLFGLSHADDYRLQQQNFHSGVVWGDFGIDDLLFYNSYYNSIEQPLPKALDMVSLLLKKYVGTNLANVLKYRSLNGHITYNPKLYDERVAKAGHPGLLPLDVQMATKALDLEDDVTVCGETCLEFFKEKKKYSLSRPSKEELEKSKSLAEKEEALLIDFSHRLRVKGVDVIFLFFPRFNRDAFTEKQIAMGLKKKNCPVIDFSNPEEYPELYVLEYSFNKYLRPEGAERVTRRITPLINEYLREHECQ